jgi:uncharacterized protein YecE (DUF72 family)
VENAGQVRIGISGWRYAGWRGKFYPPKLTQRRELEYASREFSTIEINGTFYSMHRPESFARWASETPENFVFAVKGSRYITHQKRLRETEEPLANFFAQGVLRLGEKLGPVLWQFPPNFTFDAERFEKFFRLLPHTSTAAEQIAESHSVVLRGRAWTQAGRKRALRHCVEIRHASFVVPEFIELLRKYKVGLVVADTVEWPLLMDVTADFVYCRLHGAEQLYASGYDDPALDVWAERVTAWANGGNAPDGRFAHPEKAAQTAGRDVYVYFDNDAKVRAPFDAKGLRERVARRIGEERAVVSTPMHQLASD